MVLLPNHRKGNPVLNIIVCVKQVLDPEVPSSAYKIDGESRRVICRGAPPVLNPFDENALEAALRIKDVHESRVTVISMGRMLAKAILRKALAVGADELLLLEDNTFDSFDSYTTAIIIAKAIRKIQVYDLILTGLQSADTNAGIVGPGIAEFLNIPSVTGARKAEIDDGKLLVEKAVSSGYEIVEVVTPALVTVTNELGNLRTATGAQLMNAQKKPITTWTVNDLDIEHYQKGKLELLDLFIPRVESRCEFIEGQTMAEAGANLATILVSDGLIPDLK